MTFSFAIRTVPQREVLFASLMRRLAKDGVEAHVSGDPAIAPNENACRAIEGALVARAQWVMFLEDDAGPIDDFIGSAARWLDDHVDPNVHVYPLGCQYPLGDGKATGWCYPIAMFYCSVALMLRASLAPSLVAYLRKNNHVRQGLDLMIGHWHRTVSDSEFFITPVPCFVEHLGDESTLIDGRPDQNVVGRLQGFRGYGFSYKGPNG